MQQFWPSIIQHLQYISSLRASFLL